MARIKFKIAAKTDIGLVRSNNEDNFQASSDLLVKPMRWVNNDVCQLGDKGALLVVADGMGGMNAGEVASKIAIDVVREEFSPERITAEITNSRFSIEKFMNDVVVKADNRIKETAQKKPETKGMGTTIVIAWLYKEFLYVTWCGDSRAYVYNPKYGLKRLTKDHSYVQQLVDSGKLTDYEAFDFPDSNIITRCLSDSKQKAQPESLAKPYNVCDNDVILLCTDGLCGMIRDMEIQRVVESNTIDLNRMADGLVQAALNASGADNVTICLCQILSGGGKINPDYFTQRCFVGKNADKRNTHIDNGLLKTMIVCLCLIVLLGLLATLFFGKNYCSNNSTCDSDSIIVEQDSIPNNDSIITTKDEINQSIDEEDEEEEEQNQHSNSISNSEISQEESPQPLEKIIKGLNVPNTDIKQGRKKELEKVVEDVLTPNENIGEKTEDEGTKVEEGSHSSDKIQNQEKHDSLKHSNKKMNLQSV